MIRVVIALSFAFALIAVVINGQVSSWDNAKLMALCFSFGVFVGLMLAMEFTSRGKA